MFDEKGKKHNLVLAFNGCFASTMRLTEVNAKSYWTGSHRMENDRLF